MENFNKIISVKKSIIEIDSEKINENINKNILFLLNEARRSPKSFAKKLNINDTNDKDLVNLHQFFNNNSLKVEPLFLDSNLSICSKDLLEHILLGDKIKEEMNIKSLKERLSKLNLIPINYRNFIILDATDAIDALINVFLNDEYRRKILAPEIKHIGIASGIYHTGNFCVIIDIAQSLKSINYCYKANKNKYIDEEIDDYNIKRTYDLSTNYTDKKNRYNKRIFQKEFDVENNYNNQKQRYKRYINKDIIKINREFFPYYIEYRYKYPINVYIKKKYIKDECGNIHIIYDRESNYDDGSVLIQPNIELNYDY